MVSMSHLWGLEGPVSPTSGTTAGDSHAATASPAPLASAPVSTTGSTAAHWMCPRCPLAPIPHLLVWPGQSQAEWSRSQASKLRSCSQLLDGLENSRLTWLPGYQKCSVASPKFTVAPWFPLISREIESSGPHCNGKIDGVLSLLISAAP